MSTAGLPAPETIEVVDASKVHVRIAVDDDDDAVRIESVLEALGYEVTREGEDGLGGPDASLQRIVDRLERRHRLSSDETAILRLVLRGDEVPSIATQLGLSSATVHWRLSNVHSKTRTDTREGLLRLAMFGRVARPRPRNAS